ncbi:MAG: SIS domain-containing protein [Gemmatimonadaceae bacterium]
MAGSTAVSQDAADVRATVASAAESNALTDSCTDAQIGSRTAALIDSLVADRTTANARFFADEAERIARLCHAMAQRFARHGRLIAMGLSPEALSDARHVAVEFVHPVIVGKRALPALGFARNSGLLPLQTELLARPDDIVIVFGTAEEPEAGELRAALSVARARGCLTIAFASLGAEWEFTPPQTDPFIRQELIETLYHLLWELVHVFFEHGGMLDEPSAIARPDIGPSGFLYPSLTGGVAGDDTRAAVLTDVGRSIVMKAEEVSALRACTVNEGRETIAMAAAALRSVFDAGGTLFAFGNGGSATDAMDAVADFREAPQGWPNRRALDLTEDPAILTALANDIGTEALFSRQIIAFARAGDAVLAFSTSGSSPNVILALAESRRRGLVTIALVGYDGGRVLAERLADYVIVTRSQHVPRIQEAQASAYHILRELVETSS